VNYRLATLLARTAIASDYTEDIDVDVKDPISQIIVRYDCLNGSQDNADGFPSEAITKIELIDGSDVLYSLSGVQAQAVDFYHNKREPANVVRYLNANYSYMIMNLNFGRYLYDPELALNPAQFSNLKLRISMTRGSGGSLSTAGRLTVHAVLFDQKAVSPIGFLMHKEIKNYTLGDASHEYTDLPLDHAYRKLFIRAQYDGQAIDEQIANIKLSEDVDKVVPINQSMASLIGVLCSQTRPYREVIIGAGGTSARVFYCVPTYRVGFAGAAWRPTISLSLVTLYDGDGGYFTEIQGDAGPNFSVTCEGWLPHAVIEIPFGLQNDIADWYDVSGIGNLKLDITSESSPSAGACQIMLQQLRRY